MDIEAFIPFCEYFSYVPAQHFDMDANLIEAADHLIDIDGVKLQNRRPDIRRRGDAGWAHHPHGCRCRNAGENGRRTGLRLSRSLLGSDRTRTLCTRLGYNLARALQRRSWFAL